MSSSYSGAQIGESLRPGAVLENSPLTAVKIYRAELGVAEAGQPACWTVIEFEVPETRTAQLAEILSGMLVTEGGWYCDFHSDAEVFVVFSGRVFRYACGDRTRRAQAEEYARSMGVPPAQLDWPG
jgi:hypothetical protein